MSQSLITQYPLSTSAAAVASAAVPDGFTSSSVGYNPNKPLTMAQLESEIIQRTRLNCLQTTMVIDHDILQGSNVSETEMKNDVKIRLKNAMVDNIIEKIAYTRIDNKHEHNVTVNARIYVFTREELINLIKEFQ